MDSSLITMQCFSVELRETEPPDKVISFRPCSLEEFLDPTYGIHAIMCSVQGASDIAQQRIERKKNCYDLNFLKYRFFP